jgi:hypothetical protein
MTSDLRPERIASIEVSINWSVPVQQQRGGAAGDAPRELSASDVGRELVVDDGRLVDLPVTSRPRARERKPRMSEADYRLAEARSRLHGLEDDARGRRALGVRPPA